MKRISLSVINDLVTDNRVHKVSVSLQKMGFQPLLTGRLLPESQPVSREYETYRMKLIFRKGPLFYFEYNFRLFLRLLRTKLDVLVANDLDTLPANYLAAKIKRIPLVYDSHEYYTEVPELIGRPLVKSIWTMIERWIVPKVNAAYTVCESIAGVYSDLYKVDFKVVRNLPHRASSDAAADISEPKLPSSPQVIIYQGALNIGRGIESAIRAMPYLDDAELWLAGDGDIAEALRQLVREQKLEEKVKFLGRISLRELSLLTRQAQLGISLEEDLGLNYRFALPNKLFDYIQAGVPVLVSNLPEMKHIVEHYKIGAIAETHQRKGLAESLKAALSDQTQRAVWKQNLKKAAKELYWENEEEILKNIYSPFLGGNNK